MMVSPKTHIPAQSAFFPMRSCPLESAATLDAGVRIRIRTFAELASMGGHDGRNRTGLVAAAAPSASTVGRVCALVRREPCGRRRRPLLTSRRPSGALAPAAYQFRGSVHTLRPVSSTRMTGPQCYSICAPPRGASSAVLPARTLPCTAPLGPHLRCWLHAAQRPASAALHAPLAGARRAGRRQASVVAVQMRRLSSGTLSGPRRL